MSAKIVVCRCEDVTLADVQHTIALGYRTIEEVKRYTGLGTGPCGGKECLALVGRIVAEAHGGDESKVEPFTSRPPLGQVPIGLFARADEEAEEAE